MPRIAGCGGAARKQSWGYDLPISTNNFVNLTPAHRGRFLLETIVPEKDPTSYGLLTYAWVCALSCLGGATSFAAKVRTGKARWFNFTELLGELVTSAFTGILTFYLCQNANFNGLLTAALVGIAGHMGSRAIFVMERLFEQRILGQTPPIYAPRIEPRRGELQRGEPGDGP